MRKLLTLPDDVVIQLKTRASSLGITDSRLAEVFLRRGLRSKEPIVLDDAGFVTPATQSPPLNATPPIARSNTGAWDLTAGGNTHDPDDGPNF